MVNKQKLQAALQKVRQSYHDAIAAEIKNSDKTYAEIAEQHGVSEQTVFQIARLRGVCRSSQQTNNQQVNPSELSLDGGDHEQI